MARLTAGGGSTTSSEMSNDPASLTRRQARHEAAAAAAAEHEEALGGAKPLSPTTGCARCVRDGRPAAATPAAGRAC
eukprot:COSAG01_NODE_1179_length_11363_cov_18.944701_3_plen_77_part_00